MEWVWLAAGVGLLVLGAKGLVRGGVGLARRLGVSPALIGVTIVAWGTSTPELVVSVDAAVKGLEGIALGNVIGSNIYNIIGIPGVPSLIAPTTIPPQIVAQDMWIMAVATLLLVPAMVAGRVGRPLAAAMLTGYVAYIAVLAIDTA
jgi:cation:H+ antiporter